MILQEQRKATALCGQLLLPQHFMAMVRIAYTPVYRHKSFELDAAQVEGMQNCTAFY